MDRRWKYFIVLNSNDFPYNIVEFKKTPDGELPLCCDFDVAINFDSPEELNSWVKENTSLNFENCDYHIEGHYLTVNM